MCPVHSCRVSIRIQLRISHHPIFSMKKLFFVFTSTIFVLAGLLLPSQRAYAGDFALGVYPPILQIQATAPVIVSKDITVVNASKEEENVSIVLRPFQANSSNNGQVLYLPVGTKMSPDG